MMISGENIVNVSRLLETLLRHLKLGVNIVNIARVLRIFEFMLKLAKCKYNETKT